MKKSILKKVAFKEKTFDLYKRLIAQNYLISKSTNFINKRNNHLAVFANDFIGIDIFLNGTYEKKELDALIYFLDCLKNDYHNWICLDIGANIGNHSIYFSNYFKEVHSYEPNPITFKLLDFNTHSICNIHSYNFGLGQNTEELSLYVDDHNIGASSVNKLKNESNSVQILVKKFDDEFKNFSKIDLIKIDVEGMELSVLKGSLEVIKKDQPIILIEQLKKDFVDDVKNTKSLDLLENLGYRFCWVEHFAENTNWLKRRVKNMFDLIKGYKKDNVYISTNNKNIVPVKNHSLIICLPLKHHEILLTK